MRLLRLFYAAHFSPCGSTLVCLRRQGSVLIVKNIGKVISGQFSLADTALEIDLHHLSSPGLFGAPTVRHGKYLAVAEGRISVATVSLFLATLHIFYSHGVRILACLSSHSTTGIDSLFQKPRISMLLSGAHLSLMLSYARHSASNIRIHCAISRVFK